MYKNALKFPDEFTDGDLLNIHLALTTLRQIVGLEDFGLSRDEMAFALFIANGDYTGVPTKGLPMSIAAEVADATMQAELASVEAPILAKKIAAMSPQKVGLLLISAKIYWILQYHNKPSDPLDELFPQLAA